MTDGDKDGSGELSSFLHLTGWRPVLLALVAGTAGAFGLFLALGEPSQWVARYVVNGQRVADADDTPAELDLLVDEIVTTMQLPAVIAEVERQTDLVIEEDYEITAAQSPGSTAQINVSVVGGTPEAAQAVATETSIAALRQTLVKTRTSLEGKRDQFESALEAANTRTTELIVDAGGVNPTTAYNLAVNDLLVRRAFRANPPFETVIDADGNPELVQVEEPQPPLEDLEAEVARLEPLDREYARRTAEIAELTVQLSDRNSSIREATGSILALESERENPFVISEVVTEETSRISGLLTGLLLYAVPAALFMIATFFAYDLFRKKRAGALVPAQPIDSHGVLDAASQRALPEASVTTLLVVDDDGNKTPRVSASEILDALDDQDEAQTIYDANDDFEKEDYEGDDDESESDDDDDDAKSTKSKASRWGRDASSKAG